MAASGNGADRRKVNRVFVYLDDASEPLAEYEPPMRFELDTTQLEDGPHTLRVEAYDAMGRKGVRTIPFTVRNGPGIAVQGIRKDDVLEGSIPVLVNSYGGSNEPNWEPSRAETPAPIPTWAWVLFIVVAAWGGFYFVSQWSPTQAYADAPTYQPLVAEKSAPEPSSEEVAAAEIERLSKLGAVTYSNTCAGCHLANGEGLPGLFPPLVGDPVVLDPDPTEHIRIVLAGAQGGEIDGVTYTAAMPGFAAQLSDEEVAAVVNHERTSWGNDAPTVTTADVALVREALE